jgi:sugar lactone lactonase YvrE
MRYRALILLTSVLAISCALLAVTPQFWENFTQDELLKGTLTRVSLSPEGKLSLAPAYEMVFDTGQPYIFSMARDKAGNLYLGTGHEGKVFKVDPQGKGSLYFQSKELDVFAMALDSAGTLYVGTSPDGKVYKVTGPNQATEFCNPDAKYIWALLFDDAGNLYVGTGGRGAILKVTSSGEKSTLFNPGDSNVICLARESGGDLLVGTSPGGMLIDVDAKGKAFTLLDTPMEEIHSMAIDRFGTIYVAATSSKAAPKEGSSTTVQTAGGAVPAGGIQILANLADKSKEGRTSVTAPGGERDAGGSKSSIIAIAKNGGAETIYSSEDRMVYDLMVRNDDTLLAATGGKGRLLSIDAAKQVAVVTDSPEDQMTKLVAAGDVIFVAGSNQGKVYKLESQQAQSGTFESRVLDAKVIASWGRISWRFTNPSGGSVKISTRSGNTEKTDNSWSEWSAPYAASGQQITNPNARYMQWRAVFDRGMKSAGIDTLEAVQIAYLQENLRPQVVSITVLPSGVALQKTPSTTGGTTLNLSSTTSDGQSLNSPRLRGRETNPLPPRQTLQPGAQSFTWKATDDNDDILEYSVYFRGEGESDWKLLAKELKDTFYTLDGTALPDGTYRVKVVATDAPSNPYGKALIGELISKPFVVSNTTPTITITSHDVNGKRVEIQFHAKIGAGHIASGEFSIDGGDWYLVFPTDGIADSPEEDFQVTTPELSAGEHMIGLRASDGNGNTGTTKLVVKIQ